MKVALAQMRVEGGRPVQNRARACARIEEAAAQGARLVLLPEALDFGWMHSSAQTGAGPIPEGETTQCLAEAAARHGVHVAAGCIERAGDQLFNAAVFLSPDGTLLAQHRKINELEIAHSLYARGDQVDAVSNTRLGRIGLEICADGFADEQWISRDLCRLGARIILSPCAWAVEPDFDPAQTPYGQIWRENLAPVAGECGVWILACSNVGVIEEGPWQGRKCIGNSMAFNPQGKEVLTGPFGEDADELLFLELSDSI